MGIAKLSIAVSHVPKEEIQLVPLVRKGWLLIWKLLLLSYFRRF